MLDQVTLWMDVASTAADALLLARVLQLRLHRMYLYIALACGLSVFFDGVQLWLGLNSIESQRVFLYSRFLYVFFYPLVAWDVFEEMKPQIAQMRRLAMWRLISGLIVSSIFGFLLTLLMGTYQQQGGMSTAMAFILWAGSLAASLAFLWILRRALKAQQIAQPNNTFVWMTFYQLLLISELVSCFGSVMLVFVGPPSNVTVEAILTIALMIYSFSITVWCAAKLKRIPADVSTPAKVDAG